MSTYGGRFLRAGRAGDGLMTQTAGHTVPGPHRCPLVMSRDAGNTTRSRDVTHPGWPVHRSPPATVRDQRSFATSGTARIERWSYLPGQGCEIAIDA